MANGNINEQRRLSPDTRWILTTVAAGAVVIVGVFQYQLDALKTEQLRLIEWIEGRIDRTADSVLKQALSNRLTRQQLDDAMRPRDDRLKALGDRVESLRIGKAKHSEAMASVDKAMSRLIDISVDTQARAAQTEGQLKQVLKQFEENSRLVTQIVEQQRERLSRLEGAMNPPSQVGTP